METHTNSTTRTSSVPASVLIADADVDTRLRYRNAFDRAGYDVLEASDGREALTTALVRQPSVVLTELVLPLLDGFALCEILRRDRQTANVPIVVATTEMRSAEVERARQAGADVVLTKPTSPETLLIEIHRLLARSQQLRERSQAVGARLSKQLEKSGALLGRTQQNRRTIMARAHERFTTTNPPDMPPELSCPCCGRPLTYQRSHIGGVSDAQSEQWDCFSCATCGVFQYRQRTRKLRHLRDEDGRWMTR